MDNVNDLSNRWQGVAAAITARLDELGWSQADLVRRSGLSDPTVRSLMNGKLRGTPRKPSLRKLCDALGWSPDSVDLVLGGSSPVVQPSGRTFLDRYAEMRPGSELTVEVRSVR